MVGMSALNMPVSPYGNTSIAGLGSGTTVSPLSSPTSLMPSAYSMPSFGAPSATDMLSQGDPQQSMSQLMGQILMMMNAMFQMLSQMFGGGMPTGSQNDPTQTDPLSGTSSPSDSTGSSGSDSQDTPMTTPDTPPSAGSSDSQQSPQGQSDGGGGDGGQGGGHGGGGWGGGHGGGGGGGCHGGGRGGGGWGGHGGGGGGWGDHGGGSGGQDSMGGSYGPDSTGGAGGQDTTGGSYGPDSTGGSTGPDTQTPSGTASVDGGGPNETVLKNSTGKPMKVAFFKNLGPGLQPNLGGKPDAEFEIPAGQSLKVSMPESWQGRVQKWSGKTSDPASWAEINYEPKSTNGDKNKIWFNVSLIQGYNSAMTITPTHGGASAGSNKSIIGNAPQGITAMDASGNPVILQSQPYTQGGSTNAGVTDYLYSQYGNSASYVLPDDHGAVRTSEDNSLTIDFGPA
jgi:hypothetical protein